MAPLIKKSLAQIRREEAEESVHSAKRLLERILKRWLKPEAQKPEAKNPDGTHKGIYHLVKDVYSSYFEDAGKVRWAILRRNDLEHEKDLPEPVKRRAANFLCRAISVLIRRGFVLEDVAAAVLARDPNAPQSRPERKTKALPEILTEAPREQLFSLHRLLESILKHRLKASWQRAGGENRYLLRLVTTVYADYFSYPGDARWGWKDVAWAIGLRNKLRRDDRHPDATPDAIERAAMHLFRAVDLLIRNGAVVEDTAADGTSQRVSPQGDQPKVSPPEPQRTVAPPDPGPPLFWDLFSSADSGGEPPQSTPLGQWAYQPPPPNSSPVSSPTTQQAPRARQGQKTPPRPSRGADPTAPSSADDPFSRRRPKQSTSPNAVSVGIIILGGMLVLITVGCVGLINWFGGSDNQHQTAQAKPVSKLPDPIQVSGPLFAAKSPPAIDEKDAAITKLQEQLDEQKQESAKQKARIEKLEQEQKEKKALLSKEPAPEKKPETEKEPTPPKAEPETVIVVKFKCPVPQRCVFTDRALLQYNLDFLKKLEVPCAASREQRGFYTYYYLTYQAMDYREKRFTERRKAEEFIVLLGLGGFTVETEVVPVLARAIESFKSLK